MSFFKDKSNVKSYKLELDHIYGWGLLKDLLLVVLDIM